MRRETQNVLLVLLGGALLKIGLNGDYLRYVKASHQPWLLGAAVVMLVLGGVAIVRDVIVARDAAVADHAGHHHDTRSAWLLVLPVLAVFLIAPPALGSDSVKRDAAAGAVQGGQRPGSPFEPLPPGEVVPLTMTEFVTRAGWDAENSLTGRTVTLTGFVVREAGDTMLARMVIGCCAADASPVRVRLVGEAAEPLGVTPEDTWLTVTGTVVPGSTTQETGFRPDLTVHTAREVREPADPYES
ncbi:TIGR03943 family putative permease subunit [Saccharomonospora xinjiangensis]|uniref:TIGR03943 family protein n=1 Tax=Saccharomonospora xinjiangensis XJ-54 TaxID=882086 RepID=I0UYB1_9PSEU|nr:TIGR03943 family protein [Saccharomonospora xinjiangensis]EID52864.1 TIGR03943 family protein [Saccharomonospora xinjiangensis XJ-54]